MEFDERASYDVPRIGLAVSIKEMASLFAYRDGISLNHFISIAVAEKISRLENERLNEYRAITKHQKIDVTASTIHKNFLS